MGLEKKCKSEGSKVLGVSANVNSFSKDKFSLRFNGGNISLYKWKVEGTLNARLQCHFVCKDECGNESNYSFQTSGYPYETFSKIMSGPGFTVTRGGYFRRFFNTRGMTDEDFLRDYFEKELQKMLKNIPKPDANELCEKLR